MISRSYSSDVDTKRKKADQLKTEAEQKKKNWQVKSDKAVATYWFKHINSQIDGLQSEIDNMWWKFRWIKFWNKN